MLRARLKEYVEDRIQFYQAGMAIEKAIDYCVKADEVSKKIGPLQHHTQRLTTSPQELRC